MGSPRDQFSACGKPRTDGTCDPSAHLLRQRSRRETPGAQNEFSLSTCAGGPQPVIHMGPTVSGRGCCAAERNGRGRRSRKQQAPHAVRPTQTSSGDRGDPGPIAGCRLPVAASVSEHEETGNRASRRDGDRVDDGPGGRRSHTVSSQGRGWPLELSVAVHVCGVLVGHPGHTVPRCGQVCPSRPNLSTRIHRFFRTAVGNSGSGTSQRTSESRSSSWLTSTLIPTPIVDDTDSLRMKRPLEAAGF